VESHHVSQSHPLRVNRECRPDSLLRIRWLNCWRSVDWEGICEVGYPRPKLLILLNELDETDTICTATDDIVPYHFLYVFYVHVSRRITSRSCNASESCYKTQIYWYHHLDEVGSLVDRDSKFKKRRVNAAMEMTPWSEKSHTGPQLTSSCCTLFATIHCVSIRKLTW